MNDEIENKRKKLMKNKKIVYLMMVICWILSFKVSAYSVAVILPMLEFIMILLNINNISRDILISIMEIFFRYLPMIIYVNGQVIMRMISREINKIDDDIVNSIDIEKIIDENTALIIDEDEVLKVYDIVDRFEQLSRDKQMEVLNYIKGEFNIQNNQLCNEINGLNDKYKDILQTECEDILFPDFDEYEDSYSKKKNRNIVS